MCGKQKPKASKRLIDKQLEAKMAVAKDAISAVLNSREKAGVSLRWPISKAVVEVTDDDAYTALQELSQVVERYTNAKSLKLERVSGARKEIRPVFAKLGPSFKGMAPEVADALRGADPEALEKAIEESGEYLLRTRNGNVAIKAEHFIMVERAEEGDRVAFKHGAAYIDKEITKELKDDALLREFGRCIQMTRKELGLSRLDTIELNYEAVGELGRIIPMRMKELKKSIKAAKVGKSIDHSALAKQFEIEGEIVKVSVRKVE